jgi:membrane-associated phospholipid phosphatase
MPAVSDQDPLKPLQPAKQGRRRRPLANGLIAGVLVLTVLTTLPDNRRSGDALQVVLPLAALVCASAQGEVPAILGRYVVLEVGIKGPKYLLGDHPINQRPDGGGRGFPSGHTAAATFGAAHLLNHCAGLHPATKGIVLLGAAFTGGSRIEAGRHTLWQTVAGALWGWGIAIFPWSIFSWIRRRYWGRA